jgi:hypothetical protein
VEEKEDVHARGQCHLRDRAKVQLSESVSDREASQQSLKESDPDAPSVRAAGARKTQHYCTPGCA